MASSDETDRWRATWAQALDRDDWFFEVSLGAPGEGSHVIARCDSKDDAKMVHAALADWCDRLES
jgi:hypothetical protein